MAPALGLDFGTTNTVVARADGGGKTHSMPFTSTAGVTDTMRTALSFMKDPLMGAQALKVEAALQAAGVALAPPSMFSRHLTTGTLEQPFPIYISKGSYWLTRLKSRRMTPAMSAFRSWLLEMAAETRRDTT